MRKTWRFVSSPVGLILIAAAVFVIWRAHQSVGATGAVQLNSQGANASVGGYGGYGGTASRWGWLRGGRLGYGNKSESPWGWNRGGYLSGNRNE